jgi:hypothetical protein
LIAYVKKEAVMKRILLAVSALAIAGAAALTPANAQGVGVQVGPFGAGIGVGPYWNGSYRHRYLDDYAYAGECRLIRERIETPSGRVIFRSRQVCD